VDVATGKRVWQQPGFEKGGLIAVDGTLIVMNGSNGDLTMVEASPAGYKHSDISRASAAKAGPRHPGRRRLIVRNKRTLACFDLR